MTEKRKFIIFICVAGMISLILLLYPKIFALLRKSDAKESEYGEISDAELTEDMVYDLGLYTDTSYEEELEGVLVSGKENFTSLTPPECILHLDEKLQMYLDYYLQEHYVGTASIIPNTVEEGDTNAVNFTVHLDDLDENVYCTYLIYRRRFRFKCENIESQIVKDRQ